ncbi:MAG: ATPase [Chloroflexota bacterium]|nr:ATPase [Chloroflexota bacterium]
MIADSSSLAILGGAIALAGGVLGSSMGIAVASSAGVATLSQDRKQLRNVIILAAIPMSQTLYGLIVLILVLRVVVPKLEAMPVAGGGGLTVLAIGIMAAFAFATSAACKGSVLASGISFLPKTRGRILTNSLMLAVFVELIAVLGLVFAIMALSMLGLM